jgi:hypothetical protein
VAAELEHDQDKDAAPVVQQRTPQPVIDKLFAARGELDVIFDLIAAVEQQQCVALSHVPTTKDPAAVAQHATLRLARRREQLRSTSDRIRTGTAAAREQATIADRFLQDLKEIRKEWRLCRRTSASGGNVAGSFYVDLSLPVENRGSTFISLNTSGSGATQVNIVPSAEGAACIVVLVRATDDAGGGGGAAASLPVKVIKGPQRITEELKRRHIHHSWQIIESLLSLEAKKGISGGGGSSSGQKTAAPAAAIEALRRMAAIATANRAHNLEKHHRNSSRIEDNGEDTAMMDAEATEAVPENKISLSSSAASLSCLLPAAESGFAAKDIELYCSTPSSQLEFEAWALRGLASLCKDMLTPAIIKETRGGGGGGGQLNFSILDHLRGWLRHAALCYAVQHSLTRQVQEISDVTTTTAVSTTIEATWDKELKWIISKNSRSIGILAAENGILRWYGPALLGITGQGQQLGRAQVENFIERVNNASDI